VFYDGVVGVLLEELLLDSGAAAAAAVEASRLSLNFFQLLAKPIMTTGMMRTKPAIHGSLNIANESILILLR
jgi:hypothetical protein